MLRGILLGSAWGLVLGGGVLAVLSLTYPATVQPPPETGADETPAASAQVDPTQAPVQLPTPSSTPERHDPSDIIRPGDTRADAGAPLVADAGSAPEPAAPIDDMGAAPEAAPLADTPLPAPETLVLPSPQALPPLAPVPEAEPEIATVPAEPPRAEPGEEITGFPTSDLDAMTQGPETALAETAPTADPTMVEGQETPTEPADPAAEAPEPAATPEATAAETPDTSVTAEAPMADASEAMIEPPVKPDAPLTDTPDAAVVEAPEPSTTRQNTAAAQPQPQTAQAPQTRPAPVETPAPATPRAGVNRPAETPTASLPGTPGIRLVEEQPAAVPDTAPQPDPDLPPIDRYAQPFENPEGLPVLSIVLLDSPEDGATEEIPDRFPYPISIAVPVEAPDAAERMRRYREAGYEVLALSSLPSGATPSDLEVMAAAWTDTLPEAVAIMEKPPATLQRGRNTSEQLAGYLENSGLGLLLFPEGLDTTRKLASRRGVPAATVFRDLDSAGQSEAVVRRFLDNSAFRASTEDSVILVARPRPETLEALLVWGLADRASRVALAPVSAALKRAAP